MSDFYLLASYPMNSGLSSENTNAWQPGVVLTVRQRNELDPQSSTTPKTPEHPALSLNPPACVLTCSILHLRIVGNLRLQFTMPTSLARGLQTFGEKLY